MERVNGRSRAGDCLAPNLLDYLQTHHPFVLITLDGNGFPSADVLSWLLAVDEHRIRLMVGSQRPSVANIRADVRATLQVLGRGMAYEIKGTARVIKERCESVRFPQTMLELRVDSVRENMYPANFVMSDVPVSWPASTDLHHHGWDEAVAEEMRAA